MIETPKNMLKPKNKHIHTGGLQLKSLHAGVLTKAEDRLKIRINLCTYGSGHCSAHCLNVTVNSET